MPGNALCWVCSDRVEEGVQCEGCTTWSHSKCINLSKTTTKNLSNAENVILNISCPKCGTAENRRADMLLKMINNMAKEMSEMKNLFSEQLNEAKEAAIEAKDETKMMRNELNLMKQNGNTVAPPFTQKMSYAAATKNALILKSDDDVKANEKIKSISGVLADIPIDSMKKKTNGALVLNFEKRGNLEKAKSAIEGNEDLGVNAKVGNVYNPKIMLTYVEDFDEEDDVDECKTKLMETIKRKNQHLSKVGDDDLKVIKITKAPKSKINKKHVVLRCSPGTRKSIRDHGDNIYLESDKKIAYDTYHVFRCNYCQSYNHMETNCNEKKDGKGETCAKCAGKHRTSSCTVDEHKCINCVKKGEAENDHVAYDPKCPVYKAEKMRIMNQTDHGF